MSLVYADTNFDTVFDKQIERAVRTAIRIDELLLPQNVEKWWPRIRDRLRQMLIDNLDRIHDVPISKRWQDRKKKMIGNPEWTFVRKVGGSELPVISSEPWMMTGVLKGDAKREIENDPAPPRFTNMDVRFAIGMQTGDFVPDEIYDIPYPEAVDRKLMEKSGGEIGLVRLDEQQISAIIELLVKENEDLVNRIFEGEN